MSTRITPRGCEAFALSAERPTPIRHRVIFSIIRTTPRSCLQALVTCATLGRQFGGPSGGFDVKTRWRSKDQEYHARQTHYCSSFNPSVELVAGLTSPLPRHDHTSNQRKSRQSTSIFALESVTMSLKIPKAGTPIFKDGYKVSQGIEDAVLRNIEAASELSGMLRTSFGPNGKNKIVINHLSRTFVTSDSATILRELDVVHPIGKLLVLASQQQEAELGDGSALVVMLAGELLQKAAQLITLGLHPTEVLQGYELARDKAVQELESESHGFCVQQTRHARH